MTAYMSAEQMIERQQLTVEADAKAADPQTITDDDLKNMSPEVLAKLMDAGQLGHMGIGRRRTTRRH